MCKMQVSHSVQSDTDRYTSGVGTLCVYSCVTVAIKFRLHFCVGKLPPDKSANPSVTH